MASRKFWQTEYSITLLAIFAIVMLFMPISLQNRTQALYISKWKTQYENIEYMFSVINTHISADIIKSFKEAQTSAEKEKLLLMLVKPYLRIDTEKNPPRRYRPRYMNNEKVLKTQIYNFEEFYYAEKNTIVGIKDLPRESANDPMFIMMFDVNGVLPPNRWGKDIFGVSIFEDRPIKPFGYNMSLDALKKDCSPSGSGIGCSYYYQIGGGFDG